MLLMPDSPSSPDSGTDNSALASPPRQGPGTVFLAVCLFLVIWGLKIGIVDRYGSDIPNWDQWDAEGEQLFLPYLRGELTVADFFRPHNEHRVVMTRLLALGLLAANGQWDSKLECVFNAALHALVAVVWFVMGSRLLMGRWRLVWWLIIAALVAPPHAWQNLLGGFHSQQYFLLGFSTIAIVYLVISRPWSPGWWWGVTCAVLSLFTMASGLLAAMAVIATFGAIGIRHRRLAFDQWPTVVVCVVIVVIGMWFHVTFPGHEPLKAASVREFLLAFWRFLQWPVVMVPLFPVLAVLPFLGLAVLLFRQDSPPDRRELAVFAIGIWIVLQYAATAYGRGAGALFPASRYLDTNLTGIGVLALSALIILTRHQVSEKYQTPRSFAFGLWSGAMALGLWVQLSEVLNHALPTTHAELVQREQNTQAYIWTGDPSHLNKPQIPYPGATTLRERLEPEEIRNILPASIRAPLELTGKPDPPDSFEPGGIPDELAAPSPKRIWGSFPTSGTPGSGTWKSDPLPATGSRWLKFDIAGQADADAASIVVTPLTGGAEHRFFGPVFHPDRWRSVYIRPTAGEIEIEAIDADPEAWIAFSPPVEIAFLSYWTARIAHFGFPIALSGLLAGVLGVTLGTHREKRDC